jgi:23S rRNA (adenine2030-N6)-methyltransferase
MNYRHAFHAGNFGDVLKHTVLMLCLEHLKKKPAPFRVLDTHAGAGRYALGSGPSSRTGEWRDGIGRLLGSDASPLPAAVARVLAPYLRAVQAENPDGGLSVYPGSPLLIRNALRATDKLVANELNAVEAADLAKLFAKDKACQVTTMDGYIAVKAQLPPPERRGLILIDPPFEEPGEMVRMTDALAEGLKRFQSGIYLLWYPIKEEKPIQRFHRAVVAAGNAANMPTPLCVELFLRPPRNPNLLNGAGLLIVNPPFTLETQLTGILPELATRLAEAGKGSFRVEQIGALSK